MLVREVERRNIDVHLKTTATPEFVANFKPEVLILAIGASPTKPPTPGIDTAIPALEVYKPDAKIGRKVIMVGGGLAGCETALHLADKGHDIIIVEMLDRLASEIGNMALAAINDQLARRKNITAKTGTKCIEITPNGIKTENATGETEFIMGDTVVCSIGMSARRSEVENLKAAAGNAVVFEAGDCVRGAKVYEAVSEGFLAAMKIT